MANNTSDTHELKERLASLTPSERIKLQEKLKNLKLEMANLEPKDTRNEPIAIIGMSFHFPGEVRDAAGFWEILSSMRQTIGSVPAERDKKLIWQGGYLKDIDKFDAAFFNISPREAELMDPQQRLLMEAVWRTIEDGGYDPLKLAGSKTGLYVGLSTHDYRELILSAGIEEAYSAIGTSPALISNRISYWFDFKGPSQTIDTACSSSLVALHQAVLSLRMGHCNLALVGASNLLLSPNLFISFEKAGMLSPDGHCKVFDKEANGYVRGEGVAALLLKPLKQAKAAGDRIYGVILGSAVNHGGRANSLTAPNPVAQKELLIDAYHAAEISPRTVSYIEAHGTGTPLGDPIEVEALQEAFHYLTKEDTEKLTVAHCGLGSVKANLGHLEAVAGLAGIIKVLLMLQHKQLSGQVCFQDLNPYIRLENSPFYIVSETKHWESEGCRRAGVSSFGFGGANAHVILEEGPEYSLSTEQHKSYYLLTLSAKHPDSLKQRVEDLSSYLQKNPLLPIEAIAYTLNVRRSHFNHRLAMVVNSSKELQEKLEQVHSNQKVMGCFKGQVAREPEDNMIYKEVLKSSLEKLKDVDVKTREYRILLETLADFYVKGYEIDWCLLHQGERQQALALPTYPFLQERHWAPDALHKNTLASVSQFMLHPLVGSNTSTFEEQSFKTVLIGKEFFLRDHVVAGQKVLPGVAYLEMARAAGELAFPGKKVKAILDVVWLKPMVVEEAQEIHIQLEPEGEKVRYTVSGSTEEEKPIYSQGVLSYEATELKAWENIESLSNRLPEIMQKEELYLKCRNQDLVYGESFQILQWVKTNGVEALGYYQGTLQEGYQLAPNLFDATLHMEVALHPDQGLCLPFALEELKLQNSLPQEGYVHVKAGNNISIQVLNVKGEVCVELKGLSVRQAGELKAAGLSYYRSDWKEAVLEGGIEVSTLCVFNDKDLGLQLREQHPDIRVVTLTLGDSYQQQGDDYKLRVNDYPEFIAKMQEEGFALNYFITGQSKAEASEYLEKNLQEIVDFLKSLMQAKVPSSKWVVPYELNKLASEIMLTGFAKSLYQEHPNYQMIVVGLAEKSIEVQAKILFQELASLDFHVRYQPGRQVQQYTRAELEFKENLLRQGGVYLITGGLGGLGVIFAEYLLKEYQAKLVLTGRSDLNDRLKHWKEQGASVLYLQGDVSDYATVESWIAQTKSHFGKLNGIIHSAGMIKDQLFLQKNWVDFKAILLPKIMGVLNLDRASQKEPLDYFLAFSSIAGSLGNVGQTDYATSNAFLDGFMEWRSAQAEQGFRQGKSFSISWPYWAEGGMGLDSTNERYLAKHYGLLKLPTEIGVSAFKKVLDADYNQILIHYGKEFDKTLQVQLKPVASIQILDRDEGFWVESLGYLKAQIASFLKLPLERLEEDLAFENYGFDSIMVVNLTRELEKEFGNLPKTLFFEYHTLRELTEYFVKQHAEILQEKFKDRFSQAQAGKMMPVTINSDRKIRLNGRPQIPQKDERSMVAIIGLSGRYPMANTLEELWRNLKSGKDCVTEIPKERWDYELYYDANKTKGKTYSKWGGFISDHDKFDPLFFNISPREAETLDPQERLFLEVAWQTLEDAGYTPRQLPRETGVYVGVMYGPYQLYAEEIALSSSYASIANRVSYYLNLQGPSLAVDTMCSSSLTAIHLACNSLRKGECRLALAGGVNISSHPNKYLLLSQGQFLASDGKCKSFGEGGDGYVPGEGVGAVLLKPLSEAIADGDRIYGVIRGSSINHGGFTNGYTVPNPNAQGLLIEEALKDADIEAKTISYLEAHGTGTTLGDPIEIRGLTKAFGKVPPQSCPIGSIKSNIGHLESAAGIVALTKVLLQLKYKQLVPSIHSEVLNPYIEFEETPFYVQRKLSDWQPKAGSVRRAGISSFGAGGSNAHLLIEEGPEYRLSSEQHKPYYLLTLSAKHPDALNQRVEDLNLYLQQNSSLPIEAIAYTLNVRRSHFNHRLAMVVNSSKELQEKLEQLHHSQKAIGCFRGQVTQELEDSAIYKQVLKSSLEKLKELDIQETTEYKDLLEALANLYVKGYELDWSLLHQGESQQAISLPTYPFLKERYWLPETMLKNNLKLAKDHGAVSEPLLHPLVGSNTSTLDEQSFKTVLTGNEFYLKDSVVAGQKVLPRFVYLEMARAAGELAKPGYVFNQLSQVTLLSSNEPLENISNQYIKLYPDNSDLEFEISDEKGICAQGRLSSVKEMPSISLDIQLVKQHWTSEPSASFYQQLEEMGLNYGPFFKVIKDVWTQYREVVAYLKLTNVEDFHDLERVQLVLHPSILEAVVQAISWLKRTAVFPISFEKLTLVKPLSKICYVHIVEIEDNNFQVQILDDTGVLLEIKELVVGESLVEPIGVYHYEPSWQHSEIKSLETLPSLLVINHDDLVAELKGRVSLVAVKFAENYVEEKGSYEINKANLADYRALFSALKREGLPGYIIYRNQAGPQGLGQELLCFSQALVEQKEPIEVLFINEGKDRALLTSAISAVGKVLQLEQPNIQCRTIEVEKLSGNILQQELGQREREVRYINDQREFKAYQEIPRPSAEVELTFKLKGTYLITGGAGGLGLIFAEYLIKKHKSKIVLVGRSELSPSKKSKISDLGSEVLYIQADVTHKTEVERLMQEIRAKVGPLNGIIHSAGVLNDALIAKKDPKDLDRVLTPKISGAIYLDELTRKEPLDFFILFSSVSSVFGSLGQFDYAYANGFIDGFSYHRKMLENQGLRQGKTISINWPLWAEGGIQADENFIQLAEKNLGLTTLTNEKGLSAFLMSLSSSSSQFVVLPGRRGKLEKSLQGLSGLDVKDSKVKVMPLRPELLIPEITSSIKQIVGEVLKISSDKLEERQNLSEYGIDSVGLGTLAVKLNNYYHLNLTPAIFYSQPTIQDLTIYLVTEFGEQLSARHRSPASQVQVGLEPVQAVKRSARKIVKPSVENENKGYFPVAIVGMHGLFPQSDSLESFWQHLVAGDDLITEIPDSRWDWREYYSSGQEIGKSNSKWGGFINGVDQFDAAFFNISPREAELMDPQHRLFLETVWKMFEEASYNPYALPTQAIGVFVGVQFNEYQERLLNQLEAYAATGNAHAMLPNRISYLFNLQGPSEAIDTACSSSLIAIHRAVSALHNHECRLAIAGGVSLALSPRTYVTTSQMGVLSSDGRCKTFDRAANGYVKGEGVGAILLKPLAQAKADGDKIHGVIKGSAVNHGGKAQSLTAPNPNAQSELLKAAYRVANVDPSTISYIEAHGTGTVLGDPIEINGLKKAFSEVPRKKTCGIGCVKTNIGHLEPAAGIAGVIKVLLSMQQGKLPGNVHFKELNPYIELENTPFYILDKMQDWQRPVDEQGNTLPRRAGVSSFGFGGANAHLVIEEGPEYILLSDQHKPYYLICLSAKHPDSLKQRIEDLNVYLAKNLQLPIEGISYTLNARRGHFNYRAAVVVNSTEELKQKLELVKDHPEGLGWFKGEVTGVPRETSLRGQALETRLAELNPSDTAQYKDLLEGLASQYVIGYDVDWALLHQGEAQQKISFPTYPFLKSRYWINNPSKQDPENDPGSLPRPERSLPGQNTFLPLASQSDLPLKAFALQYLQKIFSEILKMPVEQLLPDKTYEIFGVDSLSGMALIKRLEGDFGPLSQTLIFEKNCLAGLSEYFLQEHSSKLEFLFSKSINKEDFRVKEQEKHLPCLLEKPRSLSCDEEPIHHSTDDAIAIIGLSARYPLSETVLEFWDNLKSARDCITTVPMNRWNPKDYPITTKQGVRYYDQGGFISDVDKFDPLFFNISPFEASLMDPQERLFLQIAWKTVEDAGYTRQRIKEKVNNEVGVFVGTTYHFYPLYIAEAWSKGDRLPLGIQLYSIANRVSYFFNFSGPSFPIDTACSSSLAAIHMACESIKQGGCKMAIAGGVNLSLHPAKYHLLGTVGMLSENGRCMSFGSNGTGYVPGEGVGAVLLKSLKQAIEDRDPIYGIIRSSSMNHGGKTSGFTVPNPNAHSELILNALLKANINARTVNYIEAHGTGTSLGDPIEISGLQLAFKKYTQDKQFCAIGSVKSNIGHLEAAAGISQLTKVLLQLNNKTLVPSLHAETLNPHINFSETAFHVQRRLEEWRSIDGLPRRAGISSFGAGGTNVHIIVEEWVPPLSALPIQVNDNAPFVFILSAHDEKTLYQYIKTFHVFLVTEKATLQGKLENICYTLQIGRESMSSRFGVLVRKYEELLDKLDSCLKNTEPFSKGGWLNYNVQPKSTNPAALASVLSSDYELLTKQWVGGEAIDWSTLYASRFPQIMPMLPTYPFARRRCWIANQTAFSDELIEDNSCFQTPQETTGETSDKKDNLGGKQLVAQSSQALKEWLYAQIWKPVASTAINNNINDVQERGHWLIFGDKILTPHLVKKLGKEQCIQCFWGEMFAQVSPEAFTVNPSDLQDYEKMFLYITEKMEVKVTKVVYLWHCDQIDTDDRHNLDLLEMSKVEEKSEILLTVLKVLAKKAVSDRLSFSIVTRDGQAVVGGEQIHIWQHHLWALTGIFSAEHPQYSIKHIDLDGKQDLKGQLDWLYSTLFRSTNEGYFAYRNNQEYVLRLAKNTEQPDSGQKTAFEVPKTALITGGLGALGLEVANWLIDRGTQRLLLIGNTILPDRLKWKNISKKKLKSKISELMALEKKGAHIHYVAIDVSDQEKMKKLVSAFEEEWHESIESVFHLAGVTTDSITTEQMSNELLKKVLSPKVQGTLVLHEIFKLRSLKHFVLFSSVSSLPYFGLNGLTAYATANAFLEGFAYYRRSLKLPALCISWTAWQDKGMSFEYKHTALLDAVGLQALPIEKGMEILEYLLSVNYVNSIVQKVIDWNKFFNVQPNLKLKPYFEHFNQYQTISDKPVLNLSRSVINDTVTRIFSEFMQLLPDELDPKKSLQDYGVDSILGVNFVIKLAEKFPDIVSVMDLYRYNNIEKLVDYISQQQEASKKKHNFEAPLGKNTHQDLLDEIMQFSEEEVSLLLKKEIEMVGNDS